MAEKERVTKKERRTLAREERKRKEAEAAKRRKRQQAKSGLITAAIVLVVGAVVFQAVTGRPDTLEDAILISAESAEEAREAAGCEVLVEREPLPDRAHFDAASIPPADTLYPDVRPTHSGSHTTTISPVSEDGFSSQVEERATTHNLEHGSIIVWYDPEQAGDQEGDIRGWVALLNSNGFQQPPQTGTGIISAPYEDPGIGSGKGVAFRAWGTAMDCDTFDETVAHAFVAEHYGTRGIAPERDFGRYPEGVLDFSDRDVDDTPSEEAPLDDEPTAPAEGDEADDGTGDEADDDS